MLLVSFLAISYVFPPDIMVPEYASILAASFGTISIGMLGLEVASLTLASISK